MTANCLLLFFYLRLHFDTLLTFYGKFTEKQLSYKGKILNFVNTDPAVWSVQCPQISGGLYRLANRHTMAEGLGKLSKHHEAATFDAIFVVWLLWVWKLRMPFLIHTYNLSLIKIRFSFWLKYNIITSMRLQIVALYDLSNLEVWLQYPIYYYNLNLIKISFSFWSSNYTSTLMRLQILGLYYPQNLEVWLQYSIPYYNLYLIKIIFSFWLSYGITSMRLQIGQ